MRASARGAMPASLTSQNSPNSSSTCSLSLSLPLSEGAAGYESTTSPTWLTIQLWGKKKKKFPCKHKKVFFSFLFFSGTREDIVILEIYTCYIERREMEQAWCTKRLYLLLHPFERSKAPLQMILIQAKPSRGKNTPKEFWLQFPRDWDPLFLVQWNIWKGETI